MGWTPLHFAAQAGHIELIGPLLRAGAVVDELSDAPAMTPLQAAAEVGQVRVVEALLDEGADRGARTAAKGPAVVLACRNLHYATMLRLLDGASANDRDGMAALREQLEDNRRRRHRLGVPLPLLEMVVAQAVQRHCSDAAAPAPVEALERADAEDAAGDARRRRVGERLWAARNEPWPLPPLAGARWHVLEPADALDWVVPPRGAIGVAETLEIDGLRSLTEADGVFEARLPSMASVPRTALLVATQDGLRLATRGLGLLPREDPVVTANHALAHLTLLCATRSCDGDAFVLFERGDQLRAHVGLSHGARSRAANLARPPRVSPLRGRRGNPAIDHWRRLPGPSHVDERPEAIVEWRIEAVLQFRDGVFECNFHVRSDGPVTLLDDHRLAGGLSAYVDTFTDGLRSMRLVEAASPPSFHDPPLPGTGDPLALRHAWHAAIEPARAIDHVVLETGAPP